MKGLEFCGIILIFNALGLASAKENGKASRASAYRTPGGDFLIDQPENPDKIQEFHGAPPHFEELRLIHKIKDRVKREAILEERTVRITRSPNPQFSRPVAANFGKNKENSEREQKEVSISFPRLKTGVQFDAPTVQGTPPGIHGRLNPGGSVGARGDSNLQLGGGSNLEIGGGSNLQPSGGANLEIGGGSNLQLGGGSNLQPSGGANLEIGGGSNLQLGGGANLEIGGGSNFPPGGGVTLNGKIDDGSIEVADATLPSAHPGIDLGTSSGVTPATLNPSLDLIAEGGTTTNIPQVPIPTTTEGDKSTELPLGTEDSMSTTTELESASTKAPSLNDTREETKMEPTKDGASNVVTTTQKPLPRDESTTAGPKSGGDDQAKPGELLLPPNYQLLQIPKPDYGKSIGEYLPGPLICLVLIRILGISSIDEIGGSISFDADFTVEWIDGVIFDVTEQLSQPPPTAKQILRAQRTLSPVFLKKLWRPDIFMEDLIKVDQPTITNQAVLSLKFNKLTGFISYTVRMTISVNCPMSFEYYPADTQHCAFRVASYSHTKDDMSLDWLVLDPKHVGVILEDDNEDNFDIKVANIGKYEYTPKWNNVANSSFEVLTFSIAARRKISYHLIQTYLPSVFNIFVTWLVFLIPYTLYDCRIGTTMTTLLTLTAMFSAVREQSPSVNYIKAIDLWMLACVLFIFLNLVELSLMTWIRITIETFEEAADKAEDVEGGKDPEKHPDLGLDKKVDPWRIQQFRKVYSYFSRYSFAMFAALFATFNIIYWTWLFTASEYFEWVPDKDN